MSNLEEEELETKPQTGSVGGESVMRTDGRCLQRGWVGRRKVQRKKW